MAYTKKKKRKKRQAQQYEAPVTDEEKAKIQYKDDFQKKFGSRVEELASKLDGKGKQIIYALAGVAVLLILVGIFYSYQGRQDNLAQAALGNAIETSQAQVTDTPQNAGVNIKTFKTEKERSEAAIKEFEEVASKFGGAYADKSKYFIAVSRLAIDKAAGITDLEAITGTSGVVGNLAKFALAQAKFDEGKFDESAKLYQDLAAIDNPTIAKETVNFELARVYEKQDKTQEAAQLYFDIAKAASEAKDMDDQPIPMNETANKAKAKVEELDPEKAKELVTPEPPAAPGLPTG